MVQEDYSPHEVCDGYSGDLEFIYSILQQYELEMNDEFEIRNILYIEAIKWDTNVDLKTKKKVLGQLKGFTIHLYRTVPHLTCYYIAPTSYDYKERILSDERSRLLTKKVSDILDEPKEPIDNNIIDLSRHISFSENEVNEHLGRRTIGETYPKGMINIDEYHSFIDLGFQEVDETRLMIKLV